MNIIKDQHICHLDRCRIKTDFFTFFFPGKPLEKVYTCTLASNTSHPTTASNNIQTVQQQRNNSLITSNISTSGAGQTLSTANAINTARLASASNGGLINKPTVSWNIYVPNITQSNLTCISKKKIREKLHIFYIFFPKQGHGCPTLREITIFLFVNCFL